MQKRLLVLGGAGFIGSHVARLFLKRGWRVGIIDGLVEGTGGTPRNITDCQAGLDFAAFQRVEDLSNLKDHVQWADCIINAMAFTGHFIGFEQPLTDLNSNLLCHLHLIEALKSCRGKRVIYLGTRSQYGLVRAEVVTESSPCQPLDPQGINKLAAEHFFRIYGKSHGFHSLSLRLTNCYGPQQRVTGEIGLVGSFIQDVLDEKPIEIFGSAQRRKNLLYAGDAAEIIFGLTQIPWEGFNAFNVGGTEVSIQELLKMIFQAAGKGSFSVKPFPDEIKKIDVGEARFSDEKLNAFLGRTARTEVGSAVERTVEYFKQNQRSTKI